MKLFLLCFMLLFIQPIYSAPIDDDTFKQVMLISDDLGVPRSVAARLMYEESGNPGRGNPLAKGDEPTGWLSLGLYQIHTKPSNLNYLVNKYYYGKGYTEPFNIFNPIHNAIVALGYLADKHTQLGTWYHACCFYNCGCVKNVPERTKAYAMRIISAPEVNLD